MREERVLNLRDEMRREAQIFRDRAFRRPTTPPRRCRARQGVWEEKQQKEPVQCEAVASLSGLKKTKEEDVQGL